MRHSRIPERHLPPRFTQYRAGTVFVVNTGADQEWPVRYGPRILVPSLQRADGHDDRFRQQDMERPSSPKNS